MCWHWVFETGPYVMNLYYSINQTHRWPSTANKHIQVVFWCEPAGQPGRSNTARSHNDTDTHIVCVYVWVSHLCVLQQHNLDSVCKHFPYHSLCLRWITVRVWTRWQPQIQKDETNAEVPKNLHSSYWPAGGDSAGCKKTSICMKMSRLLTWFMSSVNWFQRLFLHYIYWGAIVTF